MDREGRERKRESWCVCVCVQWSQSSSTEALSSKGASETVNHYTHLKRTHLKRTVIIDRQIGKSSHHLRARDLGKSPSHQSAANTSESLKFESSDLIKTKERKKTDGWK